MVIKILWVIWILSRPVESVLYSKNISDLIFNDYDSAFKPTCGGVGQINATLGIAIRQIISLVKGPIFAPMLTHGNFMEKPQHSSIHQSWDNVVPIKLDEPNQIARFKLWVRLKWQDCFLKWDPQNFNGITNIIVPIQRVWYPDLTLYASVSTEFHGIQDFRATVYSDGTVYYNFPTVVEVLCPINVRNFPYDTQICTLKFGSWAYHGFQLDVSPRRNSGDLSQMKNHVEWNVPKVPVVKNVMLYDCCIEPYPDVTFEVYLERKPGYYVINIILPSLMITILSVLGFFLPVNSGEKVSLIITVMLSMSVFQLLTADKLPASADSTPWILFFFNFIFGLSAMTTVIQVLVINVYYRGDEHVQKWMKRFVIIPLCFIMYVEIPGQPDLCRKKNKVNQFLKEDKSAQNTMFWKCFSVALDRLGIFLFTVALTTGCAVVFTEIQKER